MAGVEIVTVKGNEVGNRLKIWISRENEDHTYVLSWRLRKENGELVTEVIREEEGGFGLVDWTPPVELAAYRPTETSFPLDLRIEELDEDGMVDHDTYTVTLQVPDNAGTRPMITDVALKPVALGAIAGVFVEQLSQVRAEIAAFSRASVIESYALQVGSRTVSSETADVTSGALAVSGMVTVICTVTDVRGYSVTEEMELEVLPYAPPRVAPATGQSKVMISRYDLDAMKDSEHGTSLRVRCSRSYSKVISEEVQLNFCRILIRTAPADTGQYGSWRQLLPESASFDTLDVLTQGEFAPTREYLVQLKAEDTAGNSSVITLRLPALGCTLHLPAGGKALAVGQYAPGQEERVDFGWQVHLHRGAGLQTLWEGSSAAVGDALSGAESSLALHYHLYLVTAGNFPFIGIRHGSTLIAGYGKYLMQFTCLEDSMTLLSNEFATGPTGVYGIV